MKTIHFAKDYVVNTENNMVSVGAAGEMAKTAKEVAMELLHDFWNEKYRERTDANNGVSVMSEIIDRISHSYFDTPEEALYLTEVSQILESLKEDLTEEEKLYTVFISLGIGTTEISKILGIPYDSAKKKKRKTIEKLKEVAKKA